MKRQNCVFYTNRGLCTHLDRGRGFLGLGKVCVLEKDFVGSCTKQVKYPMVTPQGPASGDEPDAARPRGPIPPTDD